MNTLYQEKSIIPPVLEIRKLLMEFNRRLPVWALTVFTVDGYVLGHRHNNESMPENIETVISSMSAGLITISEDFIKLVNNTKSFGQVIIEAEDAGMVSFSILLKHLAENVMLACIFPRDLELGLISFEIENLRQEIREVVRLWEVRLHEESMT